MKTIRDIDLHGKKVLIRVDFNVPLDDSGNITDDSRIRGVLPTLEYALDKQAKVILMSHCGRPKGEANPKFSMAPAAKRLGDLLGKPVAIAEDCVGPAAEKIVAGMNSGEIVMLENLRFHNGETKNDPDFAKQLAELGDVYINDAFAVSHRAHASVEGVTHHLKECGAGFLLQREIDYFNRSISNPTRPLAAVIGGAKVSTKLGAIDNLLDKVDIMIIGGAMANTFLKSQGYQIGASLVENDLLDSAAQFIEKARQKGVRFYLPVDCIVGETFSATAATKKTTIQDVPENWMILDIGPASTRLFAEALDSAKTIIWNGPMGAFEMDPFSRGSLAMVETFSSSHALTIVGGGDTNALIAKAGAEEEVSYMSTGGGAFLELMEGKELPGVTALKG